ncbi:Rieske (2Fe-2S) protein [Halomarina oriensis]|uniref:Rieske 2Fe-2S domain-containing protein n=1 Tax=Halomarina oriensis TaxID=671145 RepID=A0A6B0GNV1_9EURY|nr:Rieske (2Fe-2S) protein [Halomarina oriensis]MWG35631.1 Rieske 2Fe-2S domain-containing protein [Halomarina oriensis]
MATDPDATTSDDRFVRVADRETLEADGQAVVSEDGQAIALFHHEGEVFAVDNRCPHMGFPLSRGSIEDGILTCHWHHARFELEQGDTFDIWADDVQTFPVELREDGVYLDPDPSSDVDPATHWRNRLADGLHENLSLVMAKAIIGLDSEGGGFDTPVETAVNFGTRYREMGWGRGLTTLGCMANLYDEVGDRDKRRAMFMGVREVADETAGEPPRFQQYAFDNRDLSKSRLKAWFRNCVEVRDRDGAERVLLTAIGTLPREDVADLLFTAATDSLYLNNGHTLDFLNKAFETLEHVGWEDHADAALASTLEQLTGATRSEERSSWRQPVDIADLVFDAHDLLPDLVAAGAGKEWTHPEGFVETLLEDDPELIVDTLTDAIRAGATTEQLSDAVARAASRRVAYFATNNEFSDWNTVHHTLTYANAVHRATAKTDATELYRGCLDAAMSVYLDRFLNQPRAPVPSPGESERDPVDVREDVLTCFDEQGQVNRAANLVSEHFDAGGDPADLKRTLGRGLLREDAGFHTLQNVEAGFQRFDALVADPTTDEMEKRLALIAPARYMAAHFPTRRSAEQTFSIATRLHRGERLHEVE